MKKRKNERKGGLFDLVVHAKRNELLAEQGIFGDEVGPTTCEVGSGTEHNRVKGGLGEVEKGWFKESDETNNKWGKQIKEGGHVLGLPESCQKLSANCIQRSIGVKSRMDGVFSQDNIIRVYQGRGKLSKKESGMISCSHTLASVPATPM